MSKRRPYLDLLRAVAAFLVIVNHTNSEIFLGCEPYTLTWYLSMTWFFVSKMAVPIFVMISGSLLLERDDSYKSLFVHRILRIVVVLIVFSLIHYLLDGGRSVGGFFEGLWSGSINGTLWYLYMYIALLLALPIIRRFVQSASRKDLLYFLAVWALFVCVLPMVAAAGLPSISKYLDPPSMFGEWVGFAVLGYALARHPIQPLRRRWFGAAATACILLPIAFTVLMTAREQSVGGELTLGFQRASLLTTGLPAAALFVLVRRCFDRERFEGGRFAKFVTEVGGTAFGVYLTHAVLLRFSRRAYTMMASVVGLLPAMLVYEVGIFAVCAAVVWLLRKIPGVKKFI